MRLEELDYDGEKRKRELLWRLTGAPYKIWISEIMLQQTQVDTVISYYSRAKRLIPCAQMIMQEFHGWFLENLKDAKRLPGVGPYTVGAVLSIAYDIKVSAVDGNVLRVMTRLDNIELDINLQSTKKCIEELVSKMIPDRARDFMQSLMELGAMVC